MRTPGREKLRAENYVKSWQRGAFTYKIPVAIGGVIWRFDKRTGAASLYAKTAIVHCRWYRDTIPPHVMIGDRVVVVGDLMTTCCGDHMQLLNCVAFAKGQSWAAYRKALLELIGENVVPVSDYVPEQTEDEIYGMA